jgi:predicted lipoprotein
LRALVQQVVVPNTAAVAAESRRLKLEMAGLAAQPSLTTLRSAREQWRRALLGWKRADVFRSGPIIDTNSLMRALFWPVRTAAIDALVQGSQPLDDASIDAMGVDRRGLFALEHLLYPAELDGSAKPDEQIVAGFEGSSGARRARLAQALAGNLSSHADRVTHLLGDGKGYAGKFADGGQDSLNRVAGQLVDAVEGVAASRLGRISALAKSGQLKPTEVEGSAGRMSQQIALTYLRGAEQLYLGVDRGLSHLVKAQSAAVDDALRSAFKLALSAVSNLGRPLEEVAQQQPAALDDAAEVAEKLEHALKTELTSTLGVTATFSSVDGD